VPPIEAWVALMIDENVLVDITASREKGEIVYRVECANSLTNEEFEYYLEEMLKGICKWKPGICEENLRSFKGTIREKKKIKR
jgi:hypothetical protein